MPKQGSEVSIYIAWVIVKVSEILDKVPDVSDFFTGVTKEVYIRTP